MYAPLSACCMHCAGYCAAHSLLSYQSRLSNSYTSATCIHRDTLIIAILCSQNTSCSDLPTRNLDFRDPTCTALNTQCERPHWAQTSHQDIKILLAPIHSSHCAGEAFLQTVTAIFSAPLGFTPNLHERPCSPLSARGCRSPLSLADHPRPPSATGLPG